MKVLIRNKNIFVPLKGSFVMCDSAKLYNSGLDQGTLRTFHLNTDTDSALCNIKYVC